MPKVKFSNPLNVRKDESSRVEYKAGKIYDVDRKTADAAVKAKAGTVESAKASRSMRAGRLDRKVTVQRFETTYSDSGQPIEQWTALMHSRWASRSPVSGSERFTASQFIAKEQVAFRVRWSSALADLNPLDRVIYPAPDDKDVQEPDVTTVYDVMAVHELGRREGLRIMAARQAEG